MLKSVKCRLVGHHVNRNRVWHDGMSYRTKCESCRTPMLRTLSGWRPFDEATDGSDNRGAHPTTGRAI